MASPISIGIDLGHSSVKVSVKTSNGLALKGANINFPTVVKPWKLIANEETARKAELDTVQIDGKKFFIGVTAARQGQADTFSGQSRNWVETIEHDALLVGAWSRAMSILADNDLIYPGKMSLVLGLPTSYYLAQRGLLRARAQHLLNPKLAPGQNLQVFVEAQSRAPLLCVALDSYGQATGKAGESESWGVVEIGHFTTDFTFHDRGQEVDSISSSAMGARMAYDSVATQFKQKGYPVDIESIDTAIRTGKTKNFGQEIDVSNIVNPALSEFSTYILDEVTSRFGEKAQRMDGIIVAGGGAHLVGPYVKMTYPNATIPQNPRFTVAEGYSRFGLLTLK